MTIPAGTLRPIRKKPRWRSNLLIALLIFIILAAGIGLWATQNYLWRLPTLNSQPSTRALILDELALNYPDPSFVSNVTQALTSAGYSVQYSGPSATAIDTFRQLPSQGYSLVIIRAHQGSGQDIITSEPYSQSEFVPEQQSGALAAADVDNGPLFFAITPLFVSSSMQGLFSGATVIVMGCAALQGTQNLAVSFLDKGANFFIGWDGSVTIIHTDISTVDLVQLLASGQTVPEATITAGTADPVYGATLKYVDWSGLTQSRFDNLVSQAALWSVLAAILVFGPLSVFLAPKLFSSLSSVSRRSFRRRKKPASSAEDSAG